MSDVSDFTAVFVGPLAQRAPLMAALQRAGHVLEDDKTPRGHHWGFADLAEDGTVGTVAVRCGDVDHVVEAADRSGYTLRLHWVTPPCRACSGLGKANHGTTGLGTCLHCGGSGRTNRPVEDPMVAYLRALESRLAALEGRA